MTITNILEKKISRSRFRNPWKLGRSYQNERKPIINELAIIKYNCPSTMQSMIPSVSNIDNSWTISFLQDKKTVSELYLTNGILTELFIGSPNKNTVFGNINSSSWIRLNYFNPNTAKKETFNKEFGLIGVESHKISVSSKVTIENCDLLKNVNEKYIGAINKAFPANISVESSGGESIEILPCKQNPNCTEDGREIFNIRFNIFFKTEFDWATSQSYVVDINNFITVEILNPDGLIPDYELDLNDADGINRNSPAKRLETNFETILFNPKLVGGTFIISAINLPYDTYYDGWTARTDLILNEKFENTDKLQIAQFLDTVIGQYLISNGIPYAGLEIYINNDYYPSYDFSIYSNSNKIIMCDKVFYTDAELENLEQIKDNILFGVP